MSELKKDLFNITKKDKLKYGDMIETEMNKVNSYRSYLLLILIAIIEFGLIVGYDIPFIVQYGLMTDNILLYITTHSLILILSIIGIYWSKDYFKNKRFTLLPNTSYKTMQTIFLAIFISGIAFINGLDQATTSSISIYVTFIVVISVLTVLDLKQSLYVFIIPHIVFIISMFWNQSDGTLLVYNLINGTTFMFTSIIISYIIYNNFFHLKKNEYLLTRANKKLAVLSNTDSLTKIYNRRFGMRRITEEISRAKRNEADLGVILVDIDDFKLINDQYGHVAGDYVLVEFTELLQNHLRKEDIFIRYGGEEFLIVLPDTSKNGVSIASEKIRKLVEKHTFTYYDETFHITVSLGGVVYPKTQTSEIEALINEADKNLYKSKHTGKNKFTID